MDTSPGQFVKSAEAKLQLKTGETVQVTKSGLKFVDETPQADVRVYTASKDGYFVLEIYNSGDEDLENFQVMISWSQPQPESAQERILDKFNDVSDYLVRSLPRSLNILKKGERVYAINIPTISIGKKLKVIASCKGMKTGTMVERVFELETPSQYAI